MDWKTVYNAYPAANAAKTPVKKTVAPMPMYLFDSVGDLFSKEKLAPLQNQKKRVICSMKRVFGMICLYNAKTSPKMLILPTTGRKCDEIIERKLYWPILITFL